MIRNLKAAFGLALLAALVVSAMGALSASATKSGHFVSDKPNTILHITEATGGAHTTYLTALGSTIRCHTVKYTAPNVDETEEDLTVTPSYAGCEYNGETDKATVTMNGCHYTFTPRPAPNHGTVDFICPIGKKAEVHTPNGTFAFGEQTPKGGVVYTTAELEGTHALTVDITAEGIKYTCHGTCQIFGTSGEGAKLHGSVTVKGTNALGGGANITVT
jgi:hypothetical protein